ncbi:MAG: BrnT family toxin [bacterium]
MIFEWDEAKNRINIEKHGIGFEEAKLLFEMPHLRSFTRHDHGEIREISIGEIYEILIIVVIHTDRDGIIRIISARKASKKERSLYYDHIKKTD